MRLLTPNSSITWDNLSLHKSVEESEVIQSVGAQVLYLPPYRPDFNPIKRVFVKLKQWVRKFKLRKVDELWHKLGELCDVVSPKECQNYFKHAGYGKKLILQTNF